MRVQVKICGLTSPEDARAAAEAGADAVGLVFWPQSPRAVDVDAAREIAAALPPLVLRVGVFVDASLDEIQRCAAAVPLDLVQLHGHEPPEALADLPRRAIKALAVGPGFELEQALRYEGRAAALLLDTRSAERPGGTGAAFDWSIAARLRPRVARLILAGGLTPDNVARAVAQVGPDAMDVSSGVESAPGRKDAEKMCAFVAAVRGVAAGGVGTGATSPVFAGGGDEAWSAR